MNEKLPFWWDLIFLKSKSHTREKRGKLYFLLRSNIKKKRYEAGDKVLEYAHHHGAFLPNDFLKFQYKIVERVLDFS